MGKHIDAVTEEIKEMLDCGIKVSYNGCEINNLSDLTADLLREDDCCMKDYIEDEKGICVQVNYDILTSF